MMSGAVGPLQSERDKGSLGLRMTRLLTVFITVAHRDAVVRVRTFFRRCKMGIVWLFRNAGVCETDDTSSAIVWSESVPRVHGSGPLTLSFIIYLSCIAQRKPLSDARHSARLISLMRDRMPRCLVFPHTSTHLYSPVVHQGSCLMEI